MLVSRGAVDVPSFLFMLFMQYARSTLVPPYTTCNAVGTLVAKFSLLALAAAGKRMSTALCAIAALALPSSEPSAGMQPEELPAELKVMLDDFDARLDPAREIQLENKCNMGPRCPLPRPPMAWVASKKVGVCACAPALS